MQGSDKKGWTVQVLTGSIFDAPMYETDEASRVVVRDRDGRPAMVLVKVSESAWGVATAADEDWSEVCAKYGIS